MRKGRSKRTSEQHDDPATELAQIKRLLVLLLMKAGTPQEEIALALQVGQASISRLLPSSKVEKFKDQ